MISTAILVIVVYVLIATTKRFFNILRVGNGELLLKKKEDDLQKLREDLNKPQAKGTYATAWFIVVIFTATMIGLSLYVLTNILKFA